VRGIEPVCVRDPVGLAGHDLETDGLLLCSSVLQPAVDMIVFVQSVLPCSAEQAWEAVRTGALLLEVCRPFVAIRPLPGKSLPAAWAEGAEVFCRSSLFGLIPLGTRSLIFKRIEPERFEIQTHESDPLVKRWDHLIRVEPIDHTRCRYSDRIEIDAGLLTLLVRLFAEVFYHYRQFRWQSVARRLQRSPLLA
jgi:hypothetical protein